MTIPENHRTVFAQLAQQTTNPPVAQGRWQRLYHAAQAHQSAVTNIVVIQEATAPAAFSAIDTESGDFVTLVATTSPTLFLMRFGTLRSLETLVQNQLSTKIF